MNSELNIAELNPVKFYSETLRYPLNYLSWPMDDFSFLNQIREYEAPVEYYQKWMRDDIINLQFTTDFSNIVLEVIGDDESVYKTIIPSIVTSAIDFSPLTLYNVSVKLNTIPEGRYYLRFKVVVGTGKKYYVSEPFVVCNDMVESVLFKYYNSSNDYGVAFDTDIVFQFRAEGSIPSGSFSPDNKSKVYEDQNLNSVRLSSFPFRSFKLNIGGPAGVPNWVADKVNRIYACDNVLTDGKALVRAEGSRIERNGEDNYPMAAWSFDVREAINKRNKTFKATIIYGLVDDDGVILKDVNNKPLFTYG